MQQLRLHSSIFLLLFLLASYSLNVKSISCSISQPELKALSALYTSAGGSQWKWKGAANWSFPADPGDPCGRQWQGITCNFVEAGICNVKDVRLNAMNLAGTLPTEIGWLSGLQELQLKLNHNLVGRIPAEIGGLIKLNKMILIRNSFSGTIPSEIGQLKDLTQLNLFRNKLTGTIPQEVGALVKLNTIDLFGNSMIGPLPSQIGKLTNLLIVKIQLGKGETTSRSIDQEPEEK